MCKSSRSKGKKRHTQTCLIITDPPYNVPIEGHVSGLGKHKHREFAQAGGEMNEAEFTEFLARVYRDHPKGAMARLPAHEIEQAVLETLGKHLTTPALLRNLKRGCKRKR